MLVKFCLAAYLYKKKEHSLHISNWQVSIYRYYILIMYLTQHELVKYSLMSRETNSGSKVKAACIWEVNEHSFPLTHWNIHLLRALEQGT